MHQAESNPPRETIAFLKRIVARVAIPSGPDVEFEVNGQQVQVPDNGATLLDALRESLGIRSVKDGCSPQGQCGCCTVLVDGAPRVACVTPVRRVRGRSVVTLEGLPADDQTSWANALCSTGGSQCGFCTPGIVVRLAGLRQKKGDDVRRVDLDRALAAHLCRCTGWNTIVEAWDRVVAGTPVDTERDLDAAAARATLEGGATQRVGPEVALGQGGFAADTVPAQALVALRSAAGEWVIGETLADAQAQSGKVQGRRTTLEAQPPLAIPAGDWDATLATNWVEPGYLETDVSWCEPGGSPMSVLANGGAFGAKSDSLAAREAMRLANELGQPVRVILSREDAVRVGPKRPPLAGGVNADGTGQIVVAATPGIADVIASVAPNVEVTEVDVAGPPTSAGIRGAGWVETVALLAATRGDVGEITSPAGGLATAEIIEPAEIDERPTINVSVSAGSVLDAVVLRSYCIGAAHMAWSMVCSEEITVDETGEIHDLTIRSFGIVRPSEMPHVNVEIVDGSGPPVNGSDAVFAAVTAATWLHFGAPPVWPVAAAAG